MAYINQQTKSELAPAIKAVLKKYDMKGSIAIKNHMTLVVTISSGKLDVMDNWYKKTTKFRNTNDYGDVITKPQCLSVNQYWIDSNFSGVVKDFINELYDAMKGNIWFDKSDIQSDYFHTAYYMDVNIGKWNAPYICYGV